MLLFLLVTYGIPAQKLLYDSLALKEWHLETNNENRRRHDVKKILNILHSIGSHFHMHLDEQEAHSYFLESFGNLQS